MDSILSKMNRWFLLKALEQNFIRCTEVGPTVFYFQFWIIMTDKHWFPADILEYNMRIIGIQINLYFRQSMLLLFLTNDKDYQIMKFSTQI